MTKDKKVVWMAAWILCGLLAGCEQESKQESVETVSMSAQESIIEDAIAADEESANITEEGDEEQSSVLKTMLVSSQDLVLEELTHLDELFLLEEENAEKENKAAVLVGAQNAEAVEEPVKPDFETMISEIDKLSTGQNEIYSSSEILLETEEVKVVKRIQDTLQAQGSRVGFILLDINTGEIISSDTEYIYYGASVTKGPYVVAVNKYLTGQVNDYIKSIMEPTIRVSDNTMYEQLRITFGDEVLASFLDYTGASKTLLTDGYWYPEMTVEDLAKMWVGIYSYFYEEKNENSDWCRSLFEHSAQSYISEAVSDTYTVYSKAGWLLDEYDNARNDGGLVIAGENPYILVIMSEAFNYYDSLVELAGALNTVHECMVE